MSNCKIFRNKDKSINKVMDEFGNESQLYQDTLFHVSTLVDNIPLTPPIKHYLDKGDIMDTSVSEVALGLWAYSYSKHFRDKYNITKSNLEEVSVDDIIRHIEEYYPKPVTAIPTVVQQEVKEGVEELFESNPELANEVYESLIGKPEQGKTRLWRVGSEKNDTGIWFTDKIEDLAFYLKERENPILYYVDVTKDELTKAKAKGIGIGDNEFQFMYERGNKLSEGRIKQITPQQKQQAQQLYSNFLSNFVDNNFDTIIQDLQTKNILDKKCS